MLFGVAGYSVFEQHGFETSCGLSEQHEGQERYFAAYWANGESGGLINWRSPPSILSWSLCAHHSKAAW